LSRGISTRENYFIPLYENNIYDLRFQFPINFLSGEEALKGHKKVEFKEKLFKRDFDEFNQFLMQEVEAHRDEYKIAAKT
jgi:hypothetical protein